jgi:hypothetical protein
MKKALGLAALGLGLFMGAASLYAAAFEGEVDFNMMTKQGTGTIVYLIKGKQFRVDTTYSGHTSSAIIDGDARTMTMLMPAQKMYMSMAVPQAKPGAVSQGQLTDTGRYAVILGKTCEEWEYAGKSSTVSLWCAKGIGDFAGLTGKLNDPNGAWAEALKGKGFFPLRIVSKKSDGSVVMTMQATKFVPGAEDAGLFQVPADYHKMDMGNLGAMMGNQGQK